jgi:hypothetical protein
MKRNTAEGVCLKEVAEIGDNVTPPVYPLEWLRYFQCVVQPSGRDSTFVIRKIKQKEGNISTGFCTRPRPQDSTRRD